ncbi:putative 6-hydroxy-D-nicotine oxidase [Aspergillus steynii IBT 23096]|uniref:Putative 6-hydroxy-D-nicotine oxidase n=1 Tax=Aspergillus steynii IBT 23096 TaxID=1392250 RepID=A0A2I2GD59_9EURO|nr:putative 6-hydroxy-D-nicotine oxidase [Aspergillus steynii IBT 23096]PLB50836.1 putative 6-hydroxy-D-nicotine oxidase [Aspergillus steynii IBT 23096]
MAESITAFVDSLNLTSSVAQELQIWLGGETAVTTVLFSPKTARSAVIEIAFLVLSGFFGILLVGDPAEIPALDAHWSAAASKLPSFIALPKCANEVSIILRVIKVLGITFSVRSGGHSPNPGWSSTAKPGIVIDLHSFNQITVNQDKSFVSVGPGATWGDVYTALDPHGVSVIGGRIPSVGVGGLMLGGGFHHFSGQFGLAADNVKNFEIVLAGGTVTIANVQEKSDLFWALKGGGANFGIVTKFDLYTIPVNNIWYQIGVYSTDQVPAIFDALADWQKESSDVKAIVAVIVTLDIVTLGFIYSEPSAEVPTSFAPFNDIPAIAYAVPPTNGTVLQLTQILGASSARTPASSKVDAPLYKDAYAFWKEEATAVHESTGANQTFVIQPISAAMVEYGNTKGGNPLGLAQESRQWWTTLVDWENASDDDVVRSASIATTDKWKELATARGLHDPFIYMNDASRDQYPLSSYGAQNLAKLKAIAAKYDPSEVFQELQNDGFLLSKV